MQDNSIRPEVCVLSRSLSVRHNDIWGFGVQHVVYYLTKELLKLGVHPHIITRSKARTRGYEILSGIPIYNVGNPLCFSSFLKRLQLSHYLNFSIIHSHYTMESILHAFYRKIQISPQPFVVHVHQKPLYPPVHLPSRSRIVLNVADAIIVIDHDSKNLLCQNFNVPEDKVHVIYNGVDLNTFRPITTEEKEKTKEKYEIQGKVVLYVGKFGPRRGLHNIIKSAPRVLCDKPETTFCFVGFTREKKGYLSKIEKLSDKLNVSQNIRYFNFIPHESLSQIYGMADVFVMPDMYHGASSMTLFEAMACGVPIVATHLEPDDIPGYDQSLVDLEYGDTESLSYAITKVLSDRDLADKLSVHCRQIAENFFSWERVAKEVYNLYMDLLTDS